MEATTQFNFWGAGSGEIARPSYKNTILNIATITEGLNAINEGIKINIPRNLSEKVINNNKSFNITMSRVIDYNYIDNFIERKVIDMNARIDSEIEMVVKTQKYMYIGLFSFSTIMIIISWFTRLNFSVGIILKPMSIALLLMITLDYVLRRVK